MSATVSLRSWKAPRALTLFASLLTAILLLAGCASGDGRLSKNEYIKKSNAIQADATKAMSGVNTSGADPKEGKKLVAAIDKVIDRTKALKPPSEWQKHHDKIVKSMEQMRDSMSVVVNANGDVKKVTPEITKISDAQADYNAALTAINNDR